MEDPKVKQYVQDQGVEVKDLPKQKKGSVFDFDATVNQQSFHPSNDYRN